MKWCDEKEIKYKKSVQRKRRCYKYASKVRTKQCILQQISTRYFHSTNTKLRHNYDYLTLKIKRF